MISDKFDIEVVEKLLTENWIANAKPFLDDKPMQKLMIVWKEYAEPDIQANCNLCLQRVLDNFRAIQPLLINRVRDHNLLDAVD